MIFTNILQHPLSGLLPFAALTVLATLFAQFSALAFNAGNSRRDSYVLIPNRISFPTLYY
ncbi:MAG: hypothetical protein V4553_17225 [Bacteroidota bacterium]